MTPKAESGREPRGAAARAEKATEQATERTTEKASDKTTEKAADKARAEGRARGGPDEQSQAHRYLVAARTPLDMRGLTGQLDQTPGVSVVRTVESETRTEFPPVLVVTAGADQAAGLASAPQLVVEPDTRLTYGAPVAWAGGPDWYSGPVGVPALGTAVPITVQVTDDAGHGQAGATVTVDGPVPACAVTGNDGKARVELPVGAVDGVHVLRVRPRDACWSTVVARPTLTRNHTFDVECIRLERTLAVSGPGMATHAGTAGTAEAAGTSSTTGAGGRSGRAAAFPETAAYSWAREAMGFERVPPHYLGSGVRIALLDSGAHVRHPDLGDRVDQGWDAVSGDAKAWGEDILGSGTHCATVIVGSADGAGVIGLAPEAELHVLRVAPHGRLADLIEGLDYCIEQRIDVAQLSVGIQRPSQLLAAKIEQARRAGVLCVAAVGDGAGPVAFPAGLPTVLGVGSVGRLGTYPPESCHAEQLAGLPTPDGYFPAASANRGPGLDLVAPGVAVIGGAPTAGWAALDGTAAAAAHVTALAALVVAHHPDFHTTYRVRGPQRVDHLKALMTAACRPIAAPGARDRFGAGIPDAAVAVGIAPPGAPGFPATPASRVVPTAGW
jgi:subtilisin family serine protease